jgi:hypothetical protein
MSVRETCPASVACGRLPAFLVCRDLKRCGVSVIRAGEILRWTERLRAKKKHAPRCAARLRLEHFNNEGTVNTMATEIIAGRAGTQTIVSDSYAPFGEIQVGPPIVQDDPAKWHSPCLVEADVCRRYDGVTLEDLFAWQIYGFPKPTRTKTRLSRFSWRTDVTREWDIEKLDQWDEQIRALAAKLPKQK